MRQVDYVKTCILEVTDAEFDVIQDLYRNNLKVTAIKFLQGQYTLGLREANDICDSIGNAHLFT